MLPCIALAAVFLPYFQYSVLYAIPLTLLACSGQRRALNWVALAVLALALITFFLKFWWQPPDAGPQFFNFRLINRLMVVAMLWLLSKVLSLWLEANEYRHDPLWSDEFDRTQSQVGAMLGMLIAMPTVVVIALLDGLTPGHFNLAVLYVVPLVTCAWARNPRLLWTLCLLLEVLAIGGLYWGPQPDADEPFQRFLQSRIFNGGVMIIVTALLHYWMRSTAQVGRARVTEDSDGTGAPNGNDERVMIE